MGEHFQAKMVVATQVLFEAETVEGLLEELKKEAAYWNGIFPNGIKNEYTGTLLRPIYSNLIAEVANYPFEAGPLALKGWTDLAVHPHSESPEGRALAFYANTALAFAIAQFLWAEASWLDERNGHEAADEVAQGIGEMLVKAVRLGSSFTVNPPSFNS